jgi:hypothetical protein
MVDYEDVYTRTIAADIRMFHEDTTKVKTSKTSFSAVPTFLVDHTFRTHVKLHDTRVLSLS